MAFKIKNWEMRARGEGRRGQRVKEAGEDVNQENWRTNCTASCTASFASNNLYNILSVLVMTSISTASNLITNIQLIH